MARATFLSLPYRIHYRYIAPLLPIQDVIAVAETCHYLHPLHNPTSPYSLDRHRNVVRLFVFAIDRLHASAGASRDRLVQVLLSLLRTQLFSYEAYALLHPQPAPSPYAIALASHHPELLFALHHARFPLRWNDPGLAHHLGGDGPSWWVRGLRAASLRAQDRLISAIHALDLPAVMAELRSPHAFCIDLLSPDVLAAMRFLGDTHTPPPGAGPSTLSRVLRALRAPGPHPPGHMVYDALLRAAALAVDAYAVGMLIREARCSQLHGISPAIQILAQRAAAPPRHVPYSSWELTRALENILDAPRTISPDAIAAALFYLCAPGLSDPYIPFLRLLIRTGKSSQASREHALYIECQRTPRLPVIILLIGDHGEGVSSRCLGRCIDMVARRERASLPDHRCVLGTLQGALFTPWGCL